MAAQRSPDVHLPPFQKLVDEHAAELHRFLTGLLGADAAQDCLQETFISALRAYPRLSNADNLRAWLYTIARRKAVDAGRARRRRPTSPLDGMPRGAEPSSGPVQLPDDGLWSRVRTLPDKQRAAVVARFVLDLDYRSIAERMAISEEAARQNVAAGLRRLRREMDE